MAGALEAKTTAHNALGDTPVDGLPPALHGEKIDSKERVEVLKREQVSGRRWWPPGKGRERDGEGRERGGRVFFYVLFFARVGVSSGATVRFPPDFCPAETVAWLRLRIHRSSGMPRMAMMTRFRFHSYCVVFSPAFSSLVCYQFSSSVGKYPCPRWQISRTRKRNH